MAMSPKVRRLRLRDGLSTSEIARRTGLSRNTVKAWLKEAATTAMDLIRREVLRLSYTAHDLALFARDLGYRGTPFSWDAEDRRHRMARLGALFFRLYGLDRDDAACILGTFPIVQEADERAFGRYRTRDLVLGYMNALAAGDVDSVIAA